MTEGKKTNTLAIVGFILSFVVPLAGLVLGIIALTQINKNPDEGGKGLAIAAIVISLIMPVICLMLISGMAFFGVLSPQKLLPAKCTLGSGISCKDYVVKGSTDEIMIQVANGMGNGIVMTEMTAKPASGNPLAASCAATFTETFGGETKVLRIANGDAKTIVLSCPKGSLAKASKDSQKMYRWDIEGKYYSDESSSQYARPLFGELMAPVSG
jgi:hypothetical protein